MFYETTVLNYSDSLKNGLNQVEDQILCFPFNAPKIAVMPDNIQPPQINIQIFEVQKFGSLIAERIPATLQIRKTYQVLFGFFWQIK